MCAGPWFQLHGHPTAYMASSTAPTSTARRSPSGVRVSSTSRPSAVPGRRLTRPWATTRTTRRLGLDPLSQTSKEPQPAEGERAWSASTRNTVGPGALRDPARWDRPAHGGPRVDVRIRHAAVVQGAGAITGRVPDRIPELGAERCRRPRRIPARPRPRDRRRPTSPGATPPRGGDPAAVLPGRELDGARGPERGRERESARGRTRGRQPAGLGHRADLHPGALRSDSRSRPTVHRAS